MTSAIERLVKPRDCGLAFGLPLTEAEFRDGLDPQSPQDWVKHFRSWYGDPLPDALWSDYYLPEVVAPARQLIQSAGRIGVTVYPSFSLENLAEVAGRHIVLTLVSHWLEDGSVELSNGVYSAECFATALPDEYHYLLDLMICQSIRLADEVKKRHPRCGCLCNSRPVRLRPKLFLYGQTLVALQEGNLSYSEAVFSTYRKYLDRQK
jgi:hypothetical protein